MFADKKKEEKTTQPKRPKLSPEAIESRYQEHLRRVDGPPKIKLGGE